MLKRVFKVLFFSGMAVFSIALLSQDHNLRQITKDPAADIHVKWSPDGKKIAFASKRAGNHDIWVKDIT